MIPCSTRIRSQVRLAHLFWLTIVLTLIGIQLEIGTKIELKVCSLESEIDYVSSALISFELVRTYNQPTPNNFVGGTSFIDLGDWCLHRGIFETVVRLKYN